LIGASRSTGEESKNGGEEKEKGMDAGDGKKSKMKRARKDGGRAEGREMAGDQ